LSKGTVRVGGQLLFCFIVLYFVVNESVRYGNNIISEMLHRYSTDKGWKILTHAHPDILGELSTSLFVSDVYSGVMNRDLLS
jgi:hypothetical protein